MLMSDQFGFGRNFLTEMVIIVYEYVAYSVAMLYMICIFSIAENPINLVMLFCNSKIHQ